MADVTLCGLEHTTKGWRWYIGDEHGLEHDHRSAAMDSLTVAIGDRRKAGTLGQWGMGADRIFTGMGGGLQASKALEKKARKSR